MKKMSNILILVLLSIASVTGLIYCGDENSVTESDYTGDDTYQAKAWINIDHPMEGRTFSTLPITVSGRAGMKDGSYPESDIIGIGFYYEYYDVKGVITCDHNCIINWETSLSSSYDSAALEGKRYIRAGFEDSSDQVYINYSTYKPPQYTVSGKVTDSDSGDGIENINIWLDDNIVAYTNLGGEFQFQAVEGNYKLTPSLGSIPGACMTFDPTERNFYIYNSDISGQDFIITDELPCYTVEGTVSVDTNPGYYPDYSGRFMLKTVVNMYDNLRGNKLATTWISGDGYYKFEFIPYGPYILKPSVSYMGSDPFWGPYSINIQGHNTNIFVYYNNLWVDLYLDY